MDFGVAVLIVFQSCPPILGSFERLHISYTFHRQSRWVACNVVGTGTVGTQHAFLVHEAFMRLDSVLGLLNGLDVYFSLILICISFYLN